MDERCGRARPSRARLHGRHLMLWRRKHCCVELRCQRLGTDLGAHYLGFHAISTAHAEHAHSVGVHCANQLKSRSIYLDRRPTRVGSSVKLPYLWFTRRMHQRLIGIGASVAAVVTSIRLAWLSRAIGSIAGLVSLPLPFHRGPGPSVLADW
jgi:hypothetical protein